jgi:formamidopyrimidine-DNA glycosylase
MPELPEVETVRTGLQRLIVGKKIMKVNFDWPKSFPNDKRTVDNFLINSRIIAVRRRAKVLMIDLNTNYSLVIHLKMTGQLVFVPKSWYGEDSKSYNSGARSTNYDLQTANPSAERWGAGHPNDSLINHLPDKSTRVKIEFNDSSNLFFNDQRKFGWMRLIPTPEIADIDFIKKVGPEPLEPTFTLKVFNNQLKRKQNSNIKATLLDQTVLAGIGNIYADESLFMAGIHPASRVGAIPKSRIKLLHKAIINVLTLSIQKGGSTDRNYINAEGQKGSYIQFAKVFRKNNQPCQVCGQIIIKTKLAGRGTHLCNKCQKVYK